MRFLILAIFFPFVAHAKLTLPKNLTKSERTTVTEILGLGATPKLLSDPYPLGGYQGLEVGLGTEVISTNELSRLGSKAATQSEVSYSILRLGKGLYNDIDFFLQFSPQAQADSVASFGGQLRWGLYQAEYVPAHLSLVTALNSTNYANLISTTSQSLDLAMGFNVDDVTLFTAVGLVRASGMFIGGVDGVTDTSATEIETVTNTHYMAGIHMKFNKAFLAMQLDRYTQAVYSAQIGTRF